MKPRDEREPGCGEPLLSYVDSAYILHAQITAQLLSTSRSEGYSAWDSGNPGDEHGNFFRPSNSAIIEECSEQAREILTNLGLFRPVPGVRYGEKD